MSVLRMAILCLLAAAPAAAQAAFEVVSVKPNTSAEVRGIGMKILPGGHLQAKCMPAFVLLAYAYNVPFNRSERLSGVPEWAMAERFDATCLSRHAERLVALVDVGLLRHARGLVAGGLVQVDGILVPQQGTAVALGLFQLRVLRLQFVDELGDFRYVGGLFSEEHDVVRPNVTQKRYFTLSSSGIINYL